MPSRAGALAVLASAALGSVGCGAGAPLLHPAHVLNAGDASAGAGLSGELTFASVSDAGTAKLLQLAAEPGIAPWVAGRMGLAGDNEAGLTYTGRNVRLDVRHAFPIGDAALSVGVGGSVVLAHRSDQGPIGVIGGGVDIPVLLGVHSKSDLYALWGGPRAGFEALGTGDSSARHFIGGFVLGVRGGFRHVHVAIELDGGYHRADGSISGSSFGVGLFALTPSGALIFSF